MTLWVLMPLLALAAGAGVDVVTESREDDLVVEPRGRAVVGADAAAGEECSACLQGRCHSRRALVQSSTVTDQLAIDRTDNILFAQFSDVTLALFLDEDRQIFVQVANTTGLAVDQQTQVLYTSQDGVINGHRRASGSYTKYQAFTVDRPTTPARLRYEDTLYIINKDGSSAYYSKHSGRFAGYDNLEDYVVTDVANMKDVTSWFFTSKKKLYRFIISPTGVETSHLISGRKHAMSIDANGDNYFGGMAHKVILKFDRTAMKLKKYAFYQGPSVKDFVFDKNGNIVFLDAEGRVGQWLPGQKKCTVSRHGEISITEFVTSDDKWYASITADIDVDVGEVGRIPGRG